MAERRKRSRASARGRRRDARRLCVAAKLPADECLAAGKAARARRWVENRCGAHRSNLARLPGALRRRRAVSVWRLHTYAVAVGDPARDYMRAMMALPAWSEWRDAARREPWVLPQDEVDWPQVLRE